MNNFFLLYEAINLTDLNQFTDGMSELLFVKSEGMEKDIFWKHSSIWDLPILNELYLNYGQVEQEVMRFLMQLDDHSANIVSETEFDMAFPNGANAFLGIDFSTTNISAIKQIINRLCYTKFLKDYFENLRAYGQTNHIISALNFLYPDYYFDSKAIDDIAYWNQLDFDLYKRLHELLIDIKDYPFIGGMGKTEVLKGQSGVASKRLDGGNRVQYSLKNGIISILSCKGHYE